VISLHEIFMQIEVRSVRAYAENRLRDVIWEIMWIIEKKWRGCKLDIVRLSLLLSMGVKF
jgi:hypothetical protein